MLKFFPLVFFFLTTINLNHSFATDYSNQVSGDLSSTNSTINVKLNFKLVEIDQDCDIRIITVGNKEYASGNVSKENSSLDFKVNLNEIYTLEISNPEIGLIEHMFTCSSAANEVQHGIVLELSLIHI